jgi:hypothetical protein
MGNIQELSRPSTTRGKPTFLNLDKPYPNQIFTVLIWGESREKFGTPEEKYRDNQVCLSGKISRYRVALEIVVSDPQSIKVQKEVRRYAVSVGVMDHFKPRHPPAGRMLNRRGECSSLSDHEFCAFENVFCFILAME